MTTTYSIFFTNNFSQGNATQDYSLFSEVPQVTGITGNTAVYSNAYMTNTGVPNGGTWSISIAKKYYAFCGVAPKQVAPGVTVAVGQTKPATLGTATVPGTTFSMGTTTGKPIFDANTTATANAGAYEIDTDLFQPSQNFIIGLAGPDGDNRLVPIATVPAPPNSKVNIQPVSKYYIGAFSSSRGSVINTSASSKNCAVIDFSSNPGMLSAIVSQETNGAFTVAYSASSTVAFSALSSTPPAPQGSIGSLRHLSYQLRILTDLIDSALALSSDIFDAGLLSTSTFAARPRYNCRATWMFNPNDEQKAAIEGHINGQMVAGGYQQEFSSTTGLYLSLQYSHNPPEDLVAARQAWTTAYYSLPDNLKNYVADQRCEPAGAQNVAGLLEGPEEPAESASIAQPPLVGVAA